MQTTKQQREYRVRRLLYLLMIWFIVILGIGVLGFKFIVGTDWLDSFYNSSLHFAGAGPDVPIIGAGPKIFVSLYGVIASLIFVGLAVGSRILVRVSSYSIRWIENGFFRLHSSSTSTCRRHIQRKWSQLRRPCESGPSEFELVQNHKHIGSSIALLSLAHS